MSFSDIFENMSIPGCDISCSIEVTLPGDPLYVSDPGTDVPLSSDFTIKNDIAAGFSLTLQATCSSYNNAVFIKSFTTMLMLESMFP